MKIRFLLFIFIHFMIWNPYCWANDEKQESLKNDTQDEIVNIVKVNACSNRDCASFSKFVSTLKRVALFLTVQVAVPWLFFSGYKTWRYGFLSSQEYEDIWRDMLMYGLLFDLASKAEGGCSVFYEKSKTSQTQHCRIG